MTIKALLVWEYCCCWWLVLFAMPHAVGHTHTSECSYIGHYRGIVHLLKPCYFGTGSPPSIVRVMLVLARTIGNE